MIMCFNNHASPENRFELGLDWCLVFANRMVHTGTCPYYDERPAASVNPPASDSYQHLRLLTEPSDYQGFELNSDRHDSIKCEPRAHFRIHSITGAAPNIVPRIDFLGDQRRFRQTTLLNGVL